VIVMLVCSGVYWWWEQRPHRQTTANENAVRAPKVAQALQTAPAISQPAGIPVPAADTGTPQLAADAVAQSSTAPPANTPAVPVAEVRAPAPNPNATVRIAITADETVWVRAEVNGKYQFADTLKAHQSRNIDADGMVELRLGNAGGATITLNGNAIGPVGPKGQIRTVQFTSGGFHIVSPKPPDAPVDRR
jgi:hypothetical protein